MALVLIAFGFEPDRVYWRMADSEFQYHFLTASKLFLRAKQQQSATILNTIGSLFVEKGQKTVLEDYQESLLALNDILGSGDPAIKKIPLAGAKESPVDRLFEQFAKATRGGGF